MKNTKREWLNMSNTDVNGEKYNKVIESVNIMNIQMNRLECSQNDEFSIEKRASIDVGIDHEIKKVNIEGIELDVQIQFLILAFYSEEDEKLKVEDVKKEDTLFSVEFVLDLKYLFEIEEVDDISKELEKEIKVFVENNVPINAWPYAREVVSSLTTRMGFPALIIPPFKNVPVI